MVAFKDMYLTVDGSVIEKSSQNSSKKMLKFLKFRNYFARSAFGHKISKKTIFSCKKLEIFVEIDKQISVLGTK